MTEDTTAEFTRDQLAVETAPLRIRPKVTVACKTDLGRVRENNEDKVEYYIPEDDALLAARGLLFLVCDGMGGHAAGQIASELTCKTFIDVYLHHTAAEAAEAARAAVEAANRFVIDVGRQVPGRQGMGTTLTGLMLVQDRAVTVNLGDSRIYRLRGRDLTRLTVDHTMVEEQVRAGLLKPEQAENHPYSHILARCIGAEDSVNPDIEERDLKAGDIFLLCSDGLTNHVSDDAIAKLLALAPGDAAWKLVSAALVDGGSDNCTVIVVRVDELEDV
ncbi:MAG: serine/threonine-protein phosphatase [Armatimonadetes bacterium]|nr:serine/threonine-protein phosphatase [Armatimonadota bacterium]